MMQEWTDDGTRKERTGWRDRDISLRHRQWGFDCPAVDMDFLLLEYNHSKPVALIEYKHVNARPPILTAPTYMALKYLADNHKDRALPLMVVTYNPEFWSFGVIPVNDSAQRYFRQMGKDEILTERKFVECLYFLRGKVLNDEDKKLIANLNDLLPPDAKFQLDASDDIEW